MAKPLIELRFRDSLGPLLANLDENGKRAVQAVVDRTSVEILKEIIYATPNNSGRARAGWERRFLNDGLTAVLSNSVPYIRVLEFGSYPVRRITRNTQPRGALRRGRAYVGGAFEPGPRTTRAPGGEPEMLSPGNVSRAAPHGMVRKALGEADEQFAFDLGEELDRAMAGDGEYRVAEETYDPGRAAGLDILGGLP